MREELFFLSRGIFKVNLKYHGYDIISTVKFYPIFSSVLFEDATVISLNKITKGFG